MKRTGKIKSKGPGNPIPQESREVVQSRDRYRCVRCSGPMADWHHRRKRSVSDEHQHCACVGVAMCRTCHGWVHANPKEATESGWIVSQWEEEPWKVPFRSWRGWVVTTCDGRVLSTSATARLEHLVRNSAKVTTTRSGGASPSPS